MEVAQRLLLDDDRALSQPREHGPGVGELAALLPIAQLVMPGITGVPVGGGSDGNFTAAIGVPTLDGLGAVGGGAHADTEHLVVDAMPERARLVACLVAHLTA